ncbi:sensor histidine kinase [Pseudoduganella rhizocola]|uniref:sensor histidine kinase n=1 Tax=Pseudoduganella rhizocola TaxID=3382643 RepID=UPI0038B5CE58
MALSRKLPIMPSSPITIAAPRIDLAAVPRSLPMLAALAMAACMAVLSLPEYGHGYSLLFRAMFLCSDLVWLFPLVMIQRWMWRREYSWPRTLLILLAATYAMTLVNSVMAQVLAVELGLHPTYYWQNLYRGLDGCWLALLGFCAVHTGAAYYVALGRSQLDMAQAQLAARDAELHALRYQLHPHFLFNTLNAISALIVSQRNREATRMVTRLAEFLRATLEENGKHEHSLAEELALTDTYLNIEKARLGERLQVDTRIGPRVLNAMVPYLILQPLIENAIRHGIARIQGTGRLALYLECEGNTLVIRVDNDGAGEAESGGEKGIGLANIAERLARLYPGQHEFSHGRGADGGYSVRIVLPLRQAQYADMVRAA